MFNAIRCFIQSKQVLNMKLRHFNFILHHTKQKLHNKLCLSYTSILKLLRNGHICIFLFGWIRNNRLFQDNSLVTKIVFILKLLLESVKIDVDYGILSVPYGITRWEKKSHVLFVDVSSLHTKFYYNWSRRLDVKCYFCGYQRPRT